MRVFFRPRSAFTLMELLVALVMVSALTVTLFTDLSLGFKARARGEATIEPSRTAEGAMDLLRMDLESALTPNVNATTTAGIFEGNFEGTQGNDDRGREADDLNFYTTAESPEHVDANGEIKEVELAVETSGNDHVLVRRVLRNLSAELPPDPDEEVICRGVSGFQLEYFDGSEWQTTWDSTQDLDANSNPTIPAAVRVTLELERPEPGGTIRTYRFSRVFQLSCSTTIPGVSGGSTTGTP